MLILECAPAKEWPRLRLASVWPVCLSYSDKDHLFFSHSRCLEDNEWNYSKAGQIFTVLQVRSGNGVKDGCLWAFRKVEAGAARGWYSGLLALLTAQLLPFRPRARSQQKPSNECPKRSLWMSYCSSSTSSFFVLQHIIIPLAGLGGLTHQ